MSTARMIPTEAEDLLASVRESISRASAQSQGESAPYFVIGPEEPGLPLTGSERLQAAYGDLRSELAAFGSLPPSPPTVRGFLGRSVVWFANRLFWWPTAISRRFGAATCDFARLQVEQYEQQRQLLIRIEKRLHMVETMLSRSTVPPGPHIPNSHALVSILRKVGGEDMPVFHIGDGAGDCIEALRVAGMAIQNSTGLDVAAAPTASVGAITCFDMDGRSFRAVVHLIDSAWSVLKPGGLLILSPAAGLTSILRDRGFCEVRVEQGILVGERP